MPDSGRLPSDVVTHLRASLKQVRERFPGNSIELRVPYVGAVQCFSIPGANHHRGTPPNVAEISAQVYLKLLDGELTFTDAVNDGLLIASGRDVMRLCDVF